ncbi:MAG: type II secretion system F family protein, partial [Candidatus Hadarchaeales archaeon]
RRRAQEQELPMFAVYASVLRSAGIPLYKALQELVGGKGEREFPQFCKDAKKIRWMEAIGELEALEKFGYSTPSPLVKEYILGYTSEVRSGGDEVRYLEGKCADLLRAEEERWRRYSELVSSFGEVFLSLLIFLPLLSIVACFLSPETAGSYALVSTLIGIPVLTMIGVGTIRGTQPKTFDMHDSGLLPPLLVGGLLGILFLLSGTDLWVGLSLVLAGALLAYGLPILLQRRVIEGQERGVVEFARDVTEYVKMGHDLPSAIKRLARERHYTKHFDRLLVHVASQLEQNVPLSDLDIPSRSWLVRVTFFQLGAVARSGGYNPRTLELLTTFMGRIRHLRSTARRGLLLYRGLSLATPLILSVVVGLMGGVLLNFSSFQAPGSGGTAFEIPRPSPYLASVGALTVVVASFAVAVLSTYASEFTLKSTVWMGANLLLAGVGLSLLGSLYSVFSWI